MTNGLGVGFVMAVIVVFLILTANFQSLRVATVTVSTVPAVVAGVLVMLYATATTLNIQSAIGTIMAVGVAMANAILLVTFAEEIRAKGESNEHASLKGLQVDCAPY